MEPDIDNAEMIAAVDLTSRTTAARSAAQNPAKKETTVLGKRDHDEFANLMFSDAVTVKVVIGAQKKVYTVPKDLLCRYSGYFRGMFGGSFKEATEQKTKLDHVEPAAFQSILQFLITGDIVIPKKQRLGTDIETSQAILNEYLQILIAADYMMLSPCPGEQVIIHMKKIIKGFKACILSGDMIRKAWKLPRWHPVRKLFLQRCVMDYADAMLGKPRRKFIFDEELEIQDFAKDLLDFSIEYMYRNTALQCPGNHVIPIYLDGAVKGVLDTTTGSMENYPRRESNEHKAWVWRSL